MSIDRTDIEKFHTVGLVTLSPGFPRAWLEAANEAIEALNDADFIPEGRGDSVGWYTGSVLQPELLKLSTIHSSRTFPRRSCVRRPSNWRSCPCG